jgi:hypothetical protein
MMEANHKIRRKEPMKKTTIVMLSLVFLIPFQAYAQELSNYELQQELKALKEKTRMLEEKLSKGQTVEEGEAGALHEESSVGVKGLADRVRRIEDEMKSGLLGRWSDKITLGGVIEVEAGYEDLDFKDPSEPDTTTTDIDLATVELGVDVDIVKHVKGHVLFLYEDDEDVVVDEGLIILDGEDVIPFYLNAGKLYVPFGYYESHFISDPLTLELGETRESAVKVGFANDMFEVCAAVFNGDINETNDDDDHIDGWVASAMFTLPEDAVSGLGLTVGASYISNIADSDGLEGLLDEEFGINAITDSVGGWSAFLSASFLEKFAFEAEYVGAADEFERNDLGLGPGEIFKPRTWNFELAYAVTEALEVAVRYEGSDDALNFFPEKQYGAVASYAIFENTSLALEYLHGEFENDDERDLITAQLAIAF